MRINIPKTLNEDQENILNSLDKNKIKKNQLTSQELRDLSNNDLIPYNYVLYANVPKGLLNMPTDPGIGGDGKLKYKDTLPILSEDQTRAIVGLTTKDENGNYYNIIDPDKMKIFINAAGKDNIYNLEDAIIERNNMLNIDQETP